MAKLEMTKAGEGANEGPNKALLIILGVLCAVALFMFVVKPMLFGGDEKPSGGSPEAAPPAAQTESGPDAGTGSGGDSGAAAQPGGGVPGGSTVGEGDTTEPAPTSSAGSTIDAAYAELPADFAGKAAREDPFLSLAPDPQTATTP